MNKEIRLQFLYEKLSGSPAAYTREEAYALIGLTLDETDNERSGVPSN